MKHPDWYNFIFYWCDTLGRYGLTIPYLIGLEENYNNVKYTDDIIDQVLHEVKNYNGGQKMIISYCDDLEEHVIGLHKREYPNVKTLLGFDTLLINSDELEKLNSFAELIAYFRIQYLDIVKRKMYSKNMSLNVWESFQDSDYEEQRKILGKAQN